MNKIEMSVNYLLEKIVPAVLIFLLNILFLITILDIFSRFVLSTSLTGARAFSKYVFIWIVFIGMVCGIKEDTHFKITEIRDKLPQKLQIFIEIIMYISALIFFIVLFYTTSFVVIPNVWGRPEIATEINVGFLRLCVSIGSFLVILALIQKLVEIIRFIRGGEKK